MNIRFIQFDCPNITAVVFVRISIVKHNDLSNKNNLSTKYKKATVVNCCSKSHNELVNTSGVKLSTISTYRPFKPGFHENLMIKSNMLIVSTCQLIDSVNLVYSSIQ